VPTVFLCCLGRLCHLKQRGRKQTIITFVPLRTILVSPSSRALFLTGVPSQIFGSLGHLSPCNSDVSTNNERHYCPPPPVAPTFSVVDQGRSPPLGVLLRYRVFLFPLFFTMPCFSLDAGRQRRQVFFSGFWPSPWVPAPARYASFICCCPLACHLPVC